MAKRPIYYDTETTGLKAARERIVEIAAFDPVRDKTFVSFVRPGIAIPAEATAVHKITDEMLADAPSFAEMVPGLIEFCEGDSVLVAHNNDGFDIHFLREEFKRNGMPLPEWEFLDSLKWARRYRPDLRRHTLQSLREVYGIPANNAHRALDDVVVLHKIFSYMIDDLSFDQIADLMPLTRF